jgi:hypothetical protein
VAIDEEYRKMATSDSDFDNIRSNPEFAALLTPTATNSASNIRSNPGFESFVALPETKSIRDGNEGRHGIDLTRDQVSAGLVRFIRLERGTSVGGYERYMGSTSDTLGTLEVIGPAENVIQATLLLGRPTDISDEVLARNSALLSQFVKNIDLYWVGSDKWVDEALGRARHGEIPTIVRGSKHIKLSLNKVWGEIGVTVRNVNDVESPSSPESTQNRLPPPSQQPSTPPTTVSVKPPPDEASLKRLQGVILAKLGPANRKNVKRVDHVFSGVNRGQPGIIVQFAINDNLTKNMVKLGAREDVANILQAIANSGTDYFSVRIAGTFSMVDKFGNAKEQFVIKATFNKETVDRINWKNFNSDNVFEIADDTDIHPAMK